ncbi:carbohydrate-binding protein [Streptomyces sp. SID13031]|uniref:carbohydrate-binding protein n=1 Tax=Streptomyces sp. SID13031 TaxID=2706046 RepID=UPI0013CB10E7|nr:carbohydrate-binding protein [Streptomyces sp. SID13031]NEA30673.1 carbohydrate-binding protein [Streptomyces sp. SID13031]
MRPVPPRRLAATVLTIISITAVLVTPAAAHQTAGNTADAVAGATVPFTSYEAEAGSLGGGATSVSLTAAPTTQYSSPSLEASGHAYAHLAGTGQSVQWTNTTGRPISAVTVRLSIPDSGSGGGQTSTLNLYVDGGLRQALNVNSKQTWLYEGNNNYNGNSQSPSDGNPRVFFDETRTFVTGTPIAAGSTFTLRKDAGNSAAFYDVDVVDVESAPAAVAQPANSISITDCGAVADNTPTNGAASPASVDSRAAIQNCINQAQSQGRILWIPAGTFYVKGTQGLQAQGITIAGAGAWYSTIYRDVPLPNSTPLPALWGLNSTTIQNLHVDSNATSRASVDGAGGSMDITGTNWVADGIWTQHTLSGFWASGAGGTIRNNRLTTIWADGANINNVSMGNSVGNNLTITNNFVRGTGDDALAINSVNYNDIDGTRVFYTPMANAVLTNNTSIAPWGGKGIGVYGGSGHRIDNNYVSDTARYIGLGLGRFGVNGNDLLSATVTGNTVVRSGGNAYSQGQPAFHIGNGGDGQNVGVVDRVTATGNTILNSVYDGIGFSTSTNTQLQNNTVTSPWRNGIVVAPPFYPAPSGSATITGNTVSGGGTPFINNSGGFTASLSGNSWQQGGSPEGPFAGTPAAIPGTVQAENYNTGGQGVAYNVGSVNGSANSYRADGVDLESTSDTGGGYNVGWTSSGQWFHYTVNVATAGTYSVAMRVATPAAVTNAFHLASASGTNLSGNVSLPSTGGWQNWSTVTTQVTLPAGLQTLTVYQDSGGWNLNSLQFTSGSTTTNLAAGKPTGESSHSQAYASGNVTDGNQSSYWESTNNVFPQWTQVDLGSAQSASRVVLQLPASWGARDQTLSLLGSTDGNTFTTVKAAAAYTFSPAANNTVTVTFPASTQRYWRATITANTGWPAGQLSEFQIWT